MIDPRTSSAIALWIPKEGLTMRVHTLLTILIVTVALCASLPRFASAGPSGDLSADDTERAVLMVLDSGHALAQIDEAFASGALTFAEAKVLYAEQALIRNAYIQGKEIYGRELAARRAAFMLRMAQGTYARLAFNDKQRRFDSRQVTWLW